MSPEAEAILEATVAALTGKECWAITAGPSSGHRFTMDFGAKIPRERPLIHPTQPDDLRFNKGEIRLFVQPCPWRVQSAIAALGTWRDETANDGPFITSLRTMFGIRVQSAVVTRPGRDLTIRFENSIDLLIFPDRSERTEGNDYLLFSQDWIVVVERGGQVRVEPRA